MYNTELKYNCITPRKKGLFSQYLVVMPWVHDMQYLWAKKSADNVSGFTCFECVLASIDPKAVI